jgi:flavin reductase (DIM6/NTAB) family NADH-FMN oxidoreductase RutF
MLQKIGQQNVLYPMPVTLIGTVVDGRVNFINIAHVGILNSAPPHLISLGMAKAHYTNQGIRAHKTFSVNLPSQAMVMEADYIGLVSGKQTDKSMVFETFFGELQTAPLIKQCPVAMECRLREVVDTPTHDVFIGEVVATYANPDVLTNGKVDLAKVQPLLFDMSSRQYWTLGPAVARCWEVGKKLKPQGKAPQPE